MPAQHNVKVAESASGFADRAGCPPNGVFMLKGIALFSLPVEVCDRELEGCLLRLLPLRPGPRQAAENILMHEWLLPSELSLDDVCFDSFRRTQAFFRYTDLVPF